MNTTDLDIEIKSAGNGEVHKVDAGMATTTATNKAVKFVRNLLRLTFGIVPIVAGLDKFTDLLVTWDSYLAPIVQSAIPFSAHTFMMIVGVIEMIAGILVLWKPKIGAVIVSAWLTLIALSLLVSGIYLDIAVRDLVMAIGAFSLARLSK